MLILKGTVKNISDKSFTFSTVVCNEAQELKATYWKAKDLEIGKVYELIGDIDLDYLFTVWQHDISTYPSIEVAGTASYIKVHKKNNKNFATFSIAVNQSGKTAYYQCSYNLRTDKMVRLFESMEDKSLVGVNGSLKLTIYNTKPQLHINVSNFNLFRKTEVKPKDEFTATTTSTPLDSDFSLE